VKQVVTVWIESHRNIFPGNSLLELYSNLIVLSVHMIQHKTFYIFIILIFSCVKAQTSLKMITLFLHCLGMYYIIIFIRLNVVPNTKIPVLQICH
jgi:hypothetical protein